MNSTRRVLNPSMFDIKRVQGQTAAKTIAHGEESHQRHEMPR
ncbi:hypothetical protein [Nocardioides sp. InS609-2]|nr:hypothetical protein [Nocardioides sp. InS609-2]